MRSMLLASALLAVASAAATINATVYSSQSEPYPRLVFGVIDKKHGAAYGYYTSSLNETGWDVLNVAAGYSANETVSDPYLMLCAGYLEGALTQQAIWFEYQNLYKKMLSGYTEEEIAKLEEFYKTQRDWMTNQFDANDFWFTVGLVYYQFLGLSMGYNAVAPESQKLDLFAFDLLNGMGDFLDISRFLFDYRRPDINTLSREEILSMLYRNGHCSALIKVLPGYENIFASHSSWFVYSSMNRIYKHYAFNMTDVVLPTKLMSFSSYPGFLSSLDDFYIMDSGLVMLQTTNSIFNKTLYDYATPKALLAWHRVRIANWMSSSGFIWATILDSFNSGTYNNQYMVLDLKKIHINESIDDNALWIVEQIPGLVAADDETAILRDGYWASYNIPFFEVVYNMSGYPEVVAREGPDASYQLCPRAKIFRRDESKVTDMESMQYIMRYNDYMNDPYSEHNPFNAICSRGDLAEKPDAGGCYDTKVTDYSMTLAMRAVAENGPTHQGLPPFSWTQSGLTDPHLGQPDLFNFDFVEMTPAVP